MDGGSIVLFSILALLLSAGTLMSMNGFPMKAFFLGLTDPFTPNRHRHRAAPWYVPMLRSARTQAGLRARNVVLAVLILLPFEEA
jgi:hypothetical protein